jgi:RHS repeat-associated protein
VRLTFTTKDDIETTTATLETANLNLEQSQFLRINTAKRVNSSLFDRTNGSAPTTTLGHAQRLNGSANEKYGVAKSISVMPGDVINAEVYAKYVDPVTSNWTGAFITLIGQIAANTAGVVIDGAAYINSTSTFPLGYGVVKGTDTGGPKAYLNWLIFDRNFGLITGGFKQMGSTAKEAGTDVPHVRVFNTDPISITQPGYVYIYLSNESPTTVEVYFDDFKVTQTKSPVIQTDDYYPFGLTFNSYQRENSTPNKFKFQGQEHIDDLGLGWVSFKWRNSMPDIGRFFNVDPLAEHFYYNSTYAFSENKVTSHVELEGTEALDFRTHMAMNLGNPGAGLVSYAADWLYDKIIGGGFRMGEGAREYAKNEYDHKQYQNQPSSEQMIPEDVEQRSYGNNKMQSTGKMIQGLSDQAEGYTTLMGVFMGGLEGGAVQGTKGATKTFNNMIEGILSNPKASADDIAAQFKEGGYKATVSELRTGRGQMISIEGHAEINTIKIHGGGRRHSAARVQVIGQNNSMDVKIVNGSRSSYKGNIAEEEKAGRQFIFTEN